MEPALPSGGAGGRAGGTFRRAPRHPPAMPQSDFGHLDRIDRITRRLALLPGLLLAGSAYRGVGIPDCIHSGEDAAEAVLQALERKCHQR